MSVSEDTSRFYKSMISDLEGDKSTFPKGLSTVGWQIHEFPLIFYMYDLLKPFKNLIEPCR